jgi:hypothetical protein
MSRSSIGIAASMAVLNLILRVGGGGRRKWRQFTRQYWYGRS